MNWLPQRSKKKEKISIFLFLFGFREFAHSVFCNSHQDMNTLIFLNHTHFICLLIDAWVLTQGIESVVLVNVKELYVPSVSDFQTIYAFSVMRVYLMQPGNKRHSAVRNMWAWILQITRNQLNSFIFLSNRHSSIFVCFFLFLSIYVVGSRQFSSLVRELLWGSSTLLLTTHVS